MTENQKDCQKFQESFPLLFNGSLDREEAGMIHQHLSACPACKKEYEHEAALFVLAVAASGAESPLSDHPDIETLERMAANREGLTIDRLGAVERHLNECRICAQGLEKLKQLPSELEEILPAKEIPYLASLDEGVTGGPERQPAPFLIPSFDTRSDATPSLKQRLFPHSRKVWFAVAVAATLILLVLPNFPLRSQGPMIAVLPFEYVGPPEKEYYALGIPDEVTSQLAKVSALGVIAPTSTMYYKNTTKKPSQIGAELGVDYLLTGSIRWDTTGKIAKFRVVSRLVRARNENQLWTEPLEFVWDELCNLPGTIARKLVSALNVEFLEAERRAMEACPTGNIEAYEYYLRGLGYAKRLDKVDLAVQLLEKALELDPNFALAYARLSIYHGRFYRTVDPSEERLSKMRKTAERALELQPELPEAHLAMGWYILTAELDNERALEKCAFAEKRLPNHSVVMVITGNVQISFGKLDLALDYYKKAVKLDPLSVAIGLQLVTNHILLRNYNEAERELDRLISLTPDDLNIYLYKARNLYLQGEGSTAKARQVLREAAGKIDTTRWAAVAFLALLDLCDGDYQKALARLPNASPFGPITWMGIYSNHFFLLKAKIYRLMNQERLSRVYYDSARTDLETKATGQRPQDAFFHQMLGLAYAGLGRKEDAIREGKKALELRPVSKDAFLSPRLVEGLAEIYVMVGEYDLAIDQLEYLLSIPSYISVPYLRIDPTWAPLRNHPRFQKLINERA